MPASRFGCSTASLHRVGYMWVSTNYGYPNMNAWVGGEKLPDLNHTLSFFGSVWLPELKGMYTNAA